MWHTYKYSKWQPGHVPPALKKCQKSCVFSHSSSVSKPGILLLARTSMTASFLIQQQPTNSTAQQHSRHQPQLLIVKWLFSNVLTSRRR